MVDDDASGDPEVSARLLRQMLRKYRLAAKMTQRGAAEKCYWSESKIIRMEAGTVGVTPTDALALMDQYGVPSGEQRDEIVALARSAQRKSELSRYGKFISAATRTLVASEQQASVIRSFQPFLVPGLLQIADYTRQVLSYTRGPKEEGRIDAIVDLRALRQERVFSGDRERSLRFVMDEAVVRRMVGGPAVMLRQLRRILEASQLPYVEVLIVPFGVGMYRSLRVPYVVFEFPSVTEEELLFLEYADGDRMVRPGDVSPDEENATSPATYLEIFSEMEALTTQRLSASILREAISACEGVSESRPEVVDAPVERL